MSLRLGKTIATTTIPFLLPLPQGLLGFAFSPAFHSNNRFYVSFSVSAVVSGDKLQRTGILS